MAIIDFEISRTWLKPESKEHQLLVANRIASIRYGDFHNQHSATKDDNGMIHVCPGTNDYWLYPPGKGSTGQPKGMWRLSGRYDTEEELRLIVQILQLWL
jgi:hypothetical protein